MKNMNLKKVMKIADGKMPSKYKVKDSASNPNAIIDQDYADEIESELHKVDKKIEIWRFRSSENQVVISTLGYEMYEKNKNSIHKVMSDFGYVYNKSFPLSETKAYVIVFDKKVSDSRKVKDGYNDYANNVMLKDDPDLRRDDWFDDDDDSMVKLESQIENKYGETIGIYNYFEQNEQKFRNLDDAIYVAMNDADVNNNLEGFVICKENTNGGFKFSDEMLQIVKDCGFGSVQGEILTIKQVQGHYPIARILITSMSLDSEYDMNIVDNYGVLVEAKWVKQWRYLVAISTEFVDVHDYFEELKNSESIFEW